MQRILRFMLMPCPHRHWRLLEFHRVTIGVSFLRLALLAVLANGLLAVPHQARAATINAASCSQTAVQAAINSAVDGDTVLVPAGTCTWNSAVSISNKTITLQGAGSGSGGTVIVYGGSGHTLLSISAGTKTGKMDISGFRFVGGDSNYWGGSALVFSGPKGWKNLRIHHNVFDGNTQWAVRGYAGTYGLIDHNTFQGAAHAISLNGDGDTDWTTPLVLGTDGFLFIEDNNFNFNDDYGSTGRASVDWVTGGRLVIRNNSFVAGMVETHDRARSGSASANAWEIYNNRFSAGGTNKWKGLDISAGTGVIWGNTFTGDYTVPIGAMDYKSFQPGAIPLCNGSDPDDQNVPGQSGWRCQYQIGSQGKGATAVGYPAYIWSNTYNGAPIGMRCTNGCSPLQNGRDYINNGSAPKAGYVPFTYPHPLAQGQAPLLPSVSVNDVTQAEGSTANFAVVLSSATTQTVTVLASTANGTASAGSDYIARSAVTVTFAPGITQQTFSVTTLADAIAEGTETFNVNLSGAVNATIADAQAVGTITDAGPAAPPTISTQPATQVARQGGTATFSVGATGSAPLSYQWRKNGVAISGATGSAYTTPTLTFADNASIYSVVVSNSLGSMTSTGATLLVSALPGPVASYNFDEGSGTTLIDRSAHGNNGTISNATWNSAGKTGSSLTFNGTTSQVIIPDSATLDLSTGMTIEAWVYPTVQGGWRTIVLKEATGGLSYALYSSNDASLPNSYIGDVGADGTNALPLNTWTHVASTFDGTTLRLYVNGSPVRSTTSSVIVPTAGPLRIGGNSVWGEYFAGRIDDVRIYNRPLTQIEIRNDMNTIGTCP